MARVYSHRRSTTKKLAKPIEAMYAAGVSTVSIVMYFVEISIAVSEAGETTNWVGGFGILGLCIAIGAFVYNVGQMKKSTDLTERIICMSISSVALLCWGITMLIGMFV